MKILIIQLFFVPSASVVFIKYAMGFKKYQKGNFIAINAWFLIRRRIKIKLKSQFARFALFAWWIIIYLWGGLRRILSIRCACLWRIWRFFRMGILKFVKNLRRICYKFQNKNVKFARVCKEWNINAFSKVARLIFISIVRFLMGWNVN